MIAHYHESWVSLMYTCGVPVCLVWDTGKSMLLSAIGHREIPIPEHIDIYHLTREMAPSDKTALQCVMEVDQERIMLEKEAERLAHEDCELQLHHCGTVPFFNCLPNRCPWLYFKRHCPCKTKYLNLNGIL